MEAPIQTDRLVLRPFRDDDVQALHAIWAHPEVGPWIGGAHADVVESVEELAEHLRHQARHGFGFWAVEERSSGQLVGEVGLMLLEGRGPEVEIGWCIARDAWSRGYAHEAATRWLEAGFGDLGLDRIVAVVLPANRRSRGLCTRLGMRESGTRQAYGQDHVLYEIGDEDFRRA
jgi:RimJ/RimL family protein N-acetyltransferase